MKFNDETYSKQTNPKHYIILKYLLVFIGITPLINSRIKEKHFISNIFKRLYFILLILGLVTSSIISIMDKKTAPTLQSIAIILVGVMLSFLNLHDISSVNLWKNTNYTRLLLLYEEIDRIVHQNVCQNQSVDCKYLMKIIFWKIVLATIICGYHIGYSFSLGWSVWFDNLLKHLIVFKVVLLQHYIQQIKYRYEILGVILIKNIKFYMQGDQAELCLLKVLKDVANITVNLNEMVDLINDIYGWFVLMFTLAITLQILLYINYSIAFFARFSMSWVIILVFWTCFYLVNLICIPSKF